jgi:hypothetical protein
MPEAHRYFVGVFAFSEYIEEAELAAKYGCKEVM